MRTLTIQFRAQKATMHEEALEQARRLQSGGLFSLNDAGDQDLEWRVRESTSQYVGSEPWGINHHMWRIEQVERVACERLVIGSLELEPYEYAEEVSADDKAVRIAARALITEADLQTLSAVSEPVNVVRVGISDQPRRMTIDYVWGERPDGLAVAIRCVDVREPRVTLNSTTVDEDVLGELIRVLSSRGVLDEAALEQLRQRRHAARRVANIDGWDLMN